MRPRAERLARLLDVRNIQLRAAARLLTRATRTVDGIAGIGTQITGLREALTSRVGDASGYAVKARATTAQALGDADARQAVRLVEARAQQVALAHDVRCRSAAIDAIASVTARAVVAAEEPR